MKAIWLTDIHADHIEADHFDSFLQKVSANHPDAVFFTGDLGNAHSSYYHLANMDRLLNVPIYFTLGNHDYYGSSFKHMDKKLSAFVKNHPNLIWMDEKLCEELSGDTCVIGHTGITDGRCGDFMNGKVWIRDYEYIDDFSGLMKYEIMKLLEKRAKAISETMKHRLSVAFGRYSKVFLITHVPPWKEAATYQGKVSDENWSPHMVNSILGETIEKFMKDCSGSLTVLCGHSHGGNELDVAANIKCYTGFAQYRLTNITKIFEI